MNDHHHKASTFLGGVVVGLAAALAPGLLRPVRADELTVLRSTVDRFAASLDAADAAAIRAEVTNELWNRISASAEHKSAGSLGTFQVIGVGSVLPHLGKAYLSCRQPDGVEDVVVVTLRKTPEGAWKISGGPAGLTRGSPFE